MIRALMLMFLAWLAIDVKGQTIIQGQISNKNDGKALIGISVTVKEKNGLAVFAFTSTDLKGRYLLNFSSKSDSLLIIVSGLNIQKQSILLRNTSQVRNFGVIPEAIKLKEIKVTPPRIRRLNDTLNYLTDAFIDQNDRTIGDALKKMPGIQVKEDGSILYNNKPISKFYIEGKDLLQGRYGIATNNVAAKDVAMVQVLENHQPIKVLKDKEFKEEAAINLKLKDSAKGILTANAQLGAGAAPILYHHELSAMYFDKNKQHLDTYKGNNTGSEVSKALQSFYASDKTMKEGSSLNLQSPGLPEISQKHYLFNRANMGTVNQLWATKNDLQLTANLSYLNDRQDRESSSRSVYYLPADSLLIVEETLAATEQINYLEGTLQLNDNKDKYYLDNTLKFTGKWNQAEGKVFNSEQLFQELQKPTFRLTNTFITLKNYARATWRFYAYQGYESNPQVLKIKPLLYPELFENSAAYHFMRQSLDQESFRSLNKVTYSVNAKAFKQDYSIGFNANLKQFRSALQGLNEGGSLSIMVDSLRNDLSWNTYEVFVSPDYTYSKNKLRATLQLPLVYNYLDRNDRLSGWSNATKRVFFNPSFSLRYELSLLWNMTFRANYGNELGDLENGFTGYVLQSYRSLLRNEGALPEKKSQSYLVDLAYRHPVHEVFLNLSVSYFKKRASLMYGYDYEGIRSLKRTYELPNVNNGYLWSVIFSKGIEAIAATIRLEMEYSHSNASQISQGLIFYFQNDQYSIKPAIVSKIEKWASLSYAYQYSKSFNKIVQGDDHFKPISRSIQRGQLSFFPSKSWTVNLAMEHFYNNSLSGASKSMKFADLATKYTYKRVEFNLEYNNVFNVKEYASAVYNELSTYYTTYNLRPAQVLLKVRFKIK
ncbi:TonB-dependent receptor [Pedobacter sp. N36a]|uniref:TonB-dependent receptor n=1 Tax=Pedobacter sp. N36a TaxID=2767996 RepID=UPI001656C8C1|nr:TonB-dependent receptor [Pedobacter sp. N36a]MBC8986349.1 TonB-dependent receptor [Pedobacter sp. N36a]